MKKLLLFIFLSLQFANFKAQESETQTPPTTAQETLTSDRKNDIMLSPIELVAGSFFNASYERLLKEDAGIGVNGIFYFGKDRDEVKFSQISPYYRMYFGKKYASGFFVEGFTPITMTTTYDDYFYGD